MFVISNFIRFHGVDSEGVEIELKRGDLINEETMLRLASSRLNQMGENRYISSHICIFIYLLIEII